MLVNICSVCGSILSNIQLPYERDIKELCEKYDIDIEMLSRGNIDNEAFNNEKKAIIDKYTDEHYYCCKMKLTNFSPLVKIVR